MAALNPSYDFGLFGLDSFSPLTANEYGAATSFSANDPTSFVNYSLNQLSSLLNPLITPLSLATSQIVPDYSQPQSSLIVPQSPLTFFQTPQSKPYYDPTTGTMVTPGPMTGTPSRSVLLGGQTGGTTVNVYPPLPTNRAAQQVQQGVVAGAAAAQTAAAYTACKTCLDAKAAAEQMGAKYPYDCSTVCGTVAGNTPLGQNPASKVDCSNPTLWQIITFQCSVTDNPAIKKTLQQAAVFFLAVVVIILLLLFVRRGRED